MDISNELVNSRLEVVLDPLDSEIPFSETPASKFTVVAFVELLPECRFAVVVLDGIPQSGVSR